MTPKGSYCCLVLLLFHFSSGEDSIVPEEVLEAPLRVSACPLSLYITNSSSAAVKIAWEYPCEDSETSYKVHYAHVEWIACPFGTRSHEGRGYAETRDRQFQLLGLIPYSRYRISVKALPGNKDLPVEEDFLIAETLSIAPQVTFGRSALPTERRVESLKFFWRDPPMSRCKDFHGEISHGRYVFKGEDPWNLHDEREGRISIDENFKEFLELAPFSRYSFELYTLNHEGMMNSLEGLHLSARTLPSVPPRPLHLEVLESSLKDAVPLRWQPGYPPTGNVLRYVVKWKISEERNWLSSLSIPSSMAKAMCDDNEFQFNCYSIPELNTKHNMTFVISAYNEDVVENSEWSNEAQFLTNYTLPPIVSLDSGRESLAMWEILLIVLFSLVAVILIVGLLWIKCCNRERKYLSVPIYHSSKSASEQPSRSLSSPLTRELSKSIQNVPLPPVPGEHLYEELPNKVEIPSSSSTTGKDFKYDEEMYLQPNKLSEAKSQDSLDVSEYLVPTFPIVTDTSNAGGKESNKHSSPIPIRSYEQKRLDKS